MARLGAGDTAGDTSEDDTEAKESGGGKTVSPPDDDLPDEEMPEPEPVDDEAKESGGGKTVSPPEEEDTGKVTKPTEPRGGAEEEEDTGGAGGGIGGGGTAAPEPEPDPDPEPEPEPEPDPTDQPARGRGGAGEPEREPEPEPEEPTQEEPAEEDPTKERDEPKEEAEPPPAPEQGLEEGGDEQPVQEQAKELEAQILSQEGDLDPEDVRITRDGDTLEAELTRTGEEALTAAELGLEEQDIALGDEGVVPTSETGEAELSIREIEAGIEEQYPEAESFSIQQEEPGVFEVEVETPEGTEEFVTGEGAEDFVAKRREQRAAEREQIEEGRAIDAARKMDQQVGEISAQLSRRRERAAEEAQEIDQENLAGAIEGFKETVGIEDFEPLGGGPLIEEAPRGEQLGDVKLEIPEQRITDTAASRVRREARGEEARTIEREADTVDEFLRQGQELVSEGIQDVELGVEEMGERPGARPTPTVDVAERGGNVREFTEAGLKAPATLVGSAPFSLPILGKETAEFAGRTGQAATSGELDELAKDIKTTALATGVQAGEQAASEPVKTAGAIGGSLVLTSGLFAASRAAGPTTNLATRAAIQPGEEALGKTGAALVPGRAGKVLFPRGEPLFASEEAAIFAGRKAGRAIRRRTPDLDAGDVARRARTEATAARFKLAEMRARGAEARGGPQDIANRFETEVQERTPDELTNFFGDERGQVQIGRTRPRAETELENEQELPRQPRPQVETETESEVQAEAEQLSQIQQREVQPFAGTETAVGAEAAELTGLEQAQRPEVTAQTDQLFEAETRMDLRTEQELRMEQELETELETEVDTELRQELELEQELEQELELETELETELEQELETEAEAMRPQDQRMRREDAGVFGKVDTDVFKNIDQDLQDLAEEF